MNPEQVLTELEMQRRALVALKTQRDIDRKRRLQFIQRVQKQNVTLKNTNKRLMYAVGASLVLSVLSLIIKL